MIDPYEKNTESLELFDDVFDEGTSHKKKNSKDIELGFISEEHAVDEKDGLENEPIQPRKRFQSVSLGVMRAKKFFSDNSSKEVKKEILSQRRMSYLNKFSKTKEGRRERILSLAYDIKHGDDVSRGKRKAYVVKDDDVPRGRRESAPNVLLKATMNKISAKPNLNASTLDTYGGRSFLTTDLKYGDYEADCNALDDLLFFNFDNISDLKDLPTNEDVIVAEESLETFATAAVIDETKIRILNRGKSELEQKTRKKKKAWFWFGDLLDRRIRHNAPEKLKNQFDDQREYFTVWLSFVQVVIMSVVLCIYPFAPIGKDVLVVRKDVLLSREGILHKENLKRKVVESFWLGPSLESLILLGAKYAPCMRRDKKVYAEIEKERKNENKTGCCMQTVTDGCIQREQKDCMTPNIEFKPKSVCGQDPKYCSSASIPPTSWDLNSIIYWPKCDKKKTVADSHNDPHMTCQVTGRPCCINTQGQCVITTQDNCKFWSGIYHPDATLCSQVDCLAATCGNSFYNSDYPDQIYRLLLSLFLCAGILHLVIVLIFNLTILRDIEGYAGWFRTGLVFILSGAGGNLWSSIMLPYQAEVGESGAMFGIFACVFVEGIQNWNLLVKPWYYMAKLFGILVVMLLFGLLPYIDNFAHIFGFIYGILLGFILLPHVATKEDEEGRMKEKRKYLILRVIAFILFVLLTVLGFISFYNTQDTQSEAVALFNCPLGGTFCQNFHQGQQLEHRGIEY